MAIDRESGATKHLLASSPVLVELTNGRQGLRNPTYCGWIFVSTQMEGAHAYGGWWLNPKIPNVCRLCVHFFECTLTDCSHCRHIGECETSDTKACAGCRSAAAAPLPDTPTYD